MSDYEACRDAGVHRDNVEADPTPKANLCSEIPCAEYRDKLECRVQDLEAKVREKNLQNRVLETHLKDLIEVVDPDHHLTVGGDRLKHHEECEICAVIERGSVKRVGVCDHCDMETDGKHKGNCCRGFDGKWHYHHG